MLSAQHQKALGEHQLLIYREKSKDTLDEGRNRSENEFGNIKIMTKTTYTHPPNHSKRINVPYKQKQDQMYQSFEYVKEEYYRALKINVFSLFR